MRKEIKTKFVLLKIYLLARWCEEPANNKFGKSIRKNHRFFRMNDGG